MGRCIASRASGETLLGPGPHRRRAGGFRGVRLTLMADDATPAPRVPTAKIHRTVKGSALLVTPSLVWQKISLSALAPPAPNRSTGVHERHQHPPAPQRTRRPRQ